MTAIKSEHYLTQAEIVEFGKRWTRNNNAGLGYAPYTDVAGDDTVAAAVEAAKADGWTLVGDEPGSIKILRNADGEHMGIGGDGSGNGAWACDLDIETVTIEEMPDHLRSSHRAAHNWGTYPVNGAERSEVTREEADEIVSNDPDGYARIVEKKSR